MEKIKVVVLGSLGYDEEGMKRIKEMYAFLESNGYEVVRHIESEGMDYTDVRDFRDKKELSDKIAAHDLSWIDTADCFVALTDRQSVGTPMEVFYAKRFRGMKGVIVAENPAPTPWYIAHSDYVARDRNRQVIEGLKTIEHDVINNKKMNELLRKSRNKLIL